MNLWQPLERHLLKGQQAALILVKEARGSVPRGKGTGLVVLADGRFHGTIGGGALEWETLHQAMTFLKGVSRFEFQKIPLGPNLGQCCGGSVSLTFERWSPDRLSEVQLLANAESHGSFSTKNEKHGDKVFRQIQSTECDETFGVQRIPVAVFGAGHVGKALVLSLALTPTNITWVDTRSDMFPAISPENVSMHALGVPASILPDLAENTAIIILTHSHAQDLSILEAALKRAFSFVGVIGSQTKRSRFESLLMKSGMDNALATSFHCPIGIAGIDGKEPSVIAASVTAQILREKGMVMKN